MMNSLIDSCFLAIAVSVLWGKINISDMQSVIRTQVTVCVGSEFNCQRTCD